MDSVIKKVEEIIEPLLTSDGVELVDLTYQKQQNGWTLCLYIDKTGGISLEDCSFWSRKVGAELEHNNVFINSYNLEVSSPGIYRVIKKDKDFDRFRGKRISLRMYQTVNGLKSVTGTLLGLENGVVKVELAPEKIFNVKRDQIAKANLDPVIEI